MNPQQVADYLEYFNRYRRGEEIPLPDMTELGKVIEEAVRMLKEPRFTIQEILKAGIIGNVDKIDTLRICDILTTKSKDNE